MCSQEFKREETGIVAGVDVVQSGVAEANDELHTLRVVEKFEGGAAYRNHQVHRLFRNRIEGCQRDDSLRGGSQGSHSFRFQKYVLVSTFLH